MPSEKLEKKSKIVLKKLNIMDEMTQNNSQAELVREMEENDKNQKSIKDVKCKEWIAVIVLCFVNLINYMDRFTLAGILTNLQSYFGIQDEKGGLIQTVFIISYMVFAPLFGYLGDRYSRRWIMAAGVLLWSMTTLAGSFMTNFWWFLLFRAMVGVGEASYSTIAPTIISDLFVYDIRSKMLALFYFAIPVGSGLGYIVGSETVKLMSGEWQWALRVTPALGVVAVLLMIFVLEDPERGASEGSGHMETTSWKEDLQDIVKNKSFMFSTAGFTCVCYVAGALSWWGPKFVEMGIKLQEGASTSAESVAFKFGIIAMIAGLAGVPFGSLLAQKLRHKYHRIDAYICAFGLLLSTPFVFAACFAARYNAALCFFFIFFGEFFLNMTWSIVADMLLYVVLPTRRSTAEGFQLLFSHALGDAGSPFLIGILSEAFRNLLTSSSEASTTAVSAENVTTAIMAASADSDLNSFKALQYALLSTCFVEVIGGLFFLITAMFILQDKHKVDRAVREQGEDKNSKIMFHLASKIFKQAIPNISS